MDLRINGVRVNLWTGSIGISYSDLVEPSTRLDTSGSSQFEGGAAVATVFGVFAKNLDCMRLKSDF